MMNDLSHWSGQAILHHVASVRRLYPNIIIATLFSETVFQCLQKEKGNLDLSLTRFGFQTRDHAE